MNTQETVVPSGQHYSGNNRIPNIKQFMERLDKEKKDRDAKIDAEATGGAPKPKAKATGGEVQDHQNVRKRGKNRRTVRDPVTGQDVEIDDVDDDMLKSAEDPHVSSSDLRLSQTVTYQERG